MRKLILLILATILSIVIYAQESIDDQVIRHAKRAETAFETQNYQDAMREYEQAIKLKPDYADAYFNLALICEQMQGGAYLHRAIGYYKKYIELVPEEKDKISEKIYKLEYLAEKKVEDKEHFESLLGYWKTTTHDKKTGKPDCIVDISSFEGTLRLKLLPKSTIYSNDIVNKVATVEKYRESLYFSYTDDKTYIPNPATWDALAITAGLLGQGIGGIAGQTVAEAGQIGSDAGKHADIGKNTLKFYDFKIYEFGKDTLKGYLRRVIEEKNFQTGSVKVLLDDVSNIIFVHASEADLEPELKRVITTIGIGGFFIPEQNYYDDDYDGYHDLGIDYWEDFQYEYLRFREEERIGKIKFSGIYLNTDFLFITKKSLNKKTKLGFSMNFDFMLSQFVYNKGYKYYYEEVQAFPKDEGYSGFHEAKEEKESYNWSEIYVPGIRCAIGFSGLSKISKKLHIYWGINPVGFQGFIGGTFDNISWGLSGFVDLGIGWQISKKCIIVPTVKLSYVNNFDGDSGYYGQNGKTFMPMFQGGISFKFFGYKKY